MFARMALAPAEELLGGGPSYPSWSGYAENDGDSTIEVELMPGDPWFGATVELPGKSGLFGISSAAVPPGWESGKGITFRVVGPQPVVIGASASAMATLEEWLSEHYPDKDYRPVFV